MSFLTRTQRVCVHYTPYYEIYRINALRALRNDGRAGDGSSISVLPENGAVSDALLPKVFYESTPDFPAHQLRDGALEIIFHDSY